ncbi:hypothetical protein IKO18_02620 [bacterium]|nr:hypothetical protein [bacterium]
MNITQPEHAELSKLDYETLKAALLERLDAYFTRIFDTLDTKILFQIFREVHLHFLDKLWVDHIDEMSNLREKVGLMSYAQMDPLVIYKKESFEKFQELLANIINNTASYLLKLDFDAIATQQQAVQLIQEENNQEKVIEILSSASRNMGAARKAVEQKKVVVANEEDSRAKIFENNDDYEVFEVVDADEKPEQKVVKPQ